MVPSGYWGYTHHLTPPLSRSLTCCPSIRQYPNVKLRCKSKNDKSITMLPVIQAIFPLILAPALTTGARRHSTHRPFFRPCHALTPFTHPPSVFCRRSSVFWMLSHRYPSDNYCFPVQNFLPDRFIKTHARFREISPYMAVT